MNEPDGAEEELILSPEELQDLDRVAEEMRSYNGVSAEEAIARAKVRTEVWLRARKKNQSA